MKTVQVYKKGNLYVVRSNKTKRILGKVDNVVLFNPVLNGNIWKGILSEEINYYMLETFDIPGEKINKPNNKHGMIWLKPDGTYVYKWYPLDKQELKLYNKPWDFKDEELIQENL